MTQLHFLKQLKHFKIVVFRKSGKDGKQLQTYQFTKYAQ